MVRVNSLRCWNCGAFMNSEVEERYLEMQSKPQQTIYSDVPANEMTSLAESSSDEGDSLEDDFELSMPGAPVVSNEATESDALPIDPDKPEATSPKSDSAGSAASPAQSEDSLFDIAMQDERQAQKQRRKRAQRGGLKTPGGGLIIFCPYGCRVVVKESHRGMQGKCPECKAPFIVPVDPPDFRKEKTKAEGTETEAAQSSGYDHWLSDLHLHTVNPEKLKLKADSLLKDFTLADFAFGEDQLVIGVYNKKARAVLTKGGQPDPREELKASLQANKPLEELDLEEKYALSKEQLMNLKVVQPAASRADSIFHGISVFGNGRISIQLPAIDDKPEILYVSMGITQFWAFKKAVEEKYGITGLGENSGIPEDHAYTIHRCQITELPVKALENLDFYKVDESVELEPVGYQCGKCQIVVSEEGRAKEGLGGKTAKGIAKAKCPKCSNKMGENILYNIKVVEAPAAETAS